MKDFSYEVGDPVIRMLAGKIPVEVIVVELTDTKLICGLRPGNPDREAYGNPLWEFDRHTGVEIDDAFAEQVSHLIPKSESHNHRTKH